MTIPASYRETTFRNIIGPDAFGRIGLGFDGAGEVIRIQLSSADAGTLCRLLGQYGADQASRCQSESDSGISSVAVSVPSDSEKVCPPAKSSAACHARA